MEIKILGSGCAKCDEQLEYVQKALDELGLEADVEKVEGLKDIMSYGVMSTPAIVVDGKVVSKGRTIKVKDVVKILKKL
ncbi:MAG: thioredoxin family protein [Tissierellales bacterium]|jgi:small redox-active disulfide protein 2|nr:thioredoxin family protein [Tissierellales bacterium]